MRLYVSNLPWATTEDELKNLFAGYGKVVTCEIVKDRETGRSRGFGFVTMTDAGEGEKALAALNDYEVLPEGDQRARARRIRVEVAKSRPARR